MINHHIIKRLRGLWDSATPGQRAYGLEWYKIAYTSAGELALEFGFSPSQGCGVIAALSPGNNWERNLPSLQPSSLAGLHRRDKRIKRREDMTKITIEINY